LGAQTKSIDLDIGNHIRCATEINSRVETWKAFKECFSGQRIHLVIGTSTTCQFVVNSGWCRSKFLVFATIVFFQGTTLLLLRKKGHVSLLFEIIAAKNYTIIHCPCISLGVCWRVSIVSWVSCGFWVLWVCSFFWVFHVG
jgi:hypothetical protein